MSTGMNRGSNDLRDWLDDKPPLLPKGEHGVDAGIDADQDRASSKPWTWRESKSGTNVLKNARLSSNFNHRQSVMAAKAAS
jgi:hypothetical protein